MATATIERDFGSRNRTCYSQNQTLARLMIYCHANNKIHFFVHQIKILTYKSNRYKYVGLYIGKVGFAPRFRLLCDSTANFNLVTRQYDPEGMHPLPHSELYSF